MSIRNNTIYNLAGSGIPLVFSLITIPLYLNIIGESRYGILAIAWLLLGYFGLFDLGLGRATAQSIAVLQGKECEKRAAIFWTGLSINSALGLAGGLFCYPAAVYFFGSQFKTEGDLRLEMLSAVPWMVMAVPIATITGVLTGALQGRQKFLELNAISVAGSVLFQIVPLAVAWFYGPDLALLLPAAILSRLVTVAALGILCHQHITRGNPVAIDFTAMGSLLKYGGWFTVTALIGPLMVTFDRLVIGGVLGAQQVSYYTIPFQLTYRLTLIPQSLTTALFPRFAAEDNINSAHLAREAWMVVSVIMGPLILIGIILFHFTLALWIDPDFADQASAAGRILLLGVWANCFARIPYAQLQAKGRPDLVAKCHMAEVLPYLLILYAGLIHFGLEGVAAAFTLRTIADLLLLAGLAGGVTIAIEAMVMPTICLVAALVFVNAVQEGTAIWLIGSGVLLAAISTWAWFACPPVLRNLARNQIAWPFR